MPATLITGANKGLGLEYARQYAAAGWQVFACTRKPEAPALLELKTTHDNALRICKLDVTDHAAVDALARELADQPIDVLVNNAGSTGPKGVPECVAYQGLTNTDYSIWRDILEVNLLGAFKVATAFYPHLKASGNGRLVNMSSDLGSVAQNTKGNLYAYRSSKAGLNMMAKGMAVEWPDIVVIAMAPGWCRTDLGGADAEVEADESVALQLGVIEMLSREDSGKYLNRFGEQVPW
jgi:NAD(P)-dependent dehydrogenase (short-subunit alcohol dehydrogenase family)